MSLEISYMQETFFNHTEFLARHSQHNPALEMLQRAGMPSTAAKRPKLEYLKILGPGHQFVSFPGIRPR